jgi:hypothetical protein
MTSEALWVVMQGKGVVFWQGAKSETARCGVGLTRCATGPHQPRGLAVAGEACLEGWAS